MHDAFEASTEVADCVRAQAPRHLLVVAIGDVAGAGLAAVAGERAVYRLPAGSTPGSGSSHDPWLPFNDATFDCVVLYRVTSHDVDIALLLGEASRVLQPQGRVIVLEHHKDFAFAPLPNAGPAHLLHGWLRDAGFAQVDISESDGLRVVAQAHA